MLKPIITVIAAVSICACAAHRPPAPEPDWEARGWVNATLPELRGALARGEVTSETLVRAYLDRIDTVDRDGPRLQAILALNPGAVAAARAIDERRAAGAALGALAGIPILLKDNIESADSMATTAGSLALADNVTGRDAPLVAGLRAADAVILGKANLSEWANFRSRHSISGWSAVGGQVRNPHMLDRSPCGSSSGSGAAVAAALTAAAVGTETNGSIICPAHATGIVGFKPTVGLVSQRHIVPISSSQDTAGPMTRTVTGAALLLGPMAGNGIDYAAGLEPGALAGTRVGVLRFSVGPNRGIGARFDAALALLESAGAELVEITEFELAADDFWGQARAALEHEFRATLNGYLADAAPEVATRSLADVIAFNEAHRARELALFDQGIMIAAEGRAGLDDPGYQAALANVQRATREHGIDRLLGDYDAEVLVSPSGPLATRFDPVNGDVWPAWVGGGYLAAIAGYPHLTVPMGEVHGVPVGLSFIGARNSDARILAYGYAFEQASRLRVEPGYLDSAEARPEIERALRPPTD